MGVLRKIYLLLFPIMLAGCTEAFMPDVDTKPVLCLNSLITAGEPIEVSLTHTWLYTDVEGSRNNQVHDGVVSIYANGVKVGEDYLPQECDRIRIVAESPTYGTAEAEVTVPVSAPVELVNWDAEISGRWNWDKTKLYYMIGLKAQMTVHDPAGIENYYNFSYKGFPENEQTDDADKSQVLFNPGHLFYDCDPIFSEHISGFDEISGNSSFGFTFFTDRQFSGKQYTLNIQLSDAYFEIIDNGDLVLTDDMLDCGFILILSSVSQSYYNWCNYQWNVENGILGDLGEIGMVDPVWGYSNVSTGAGVVAAQARVSYTINLKDLLKSEISDQ